MIKRNALLRKAINKLYDSVFAPVAPTCNALAKELKNVCILLIYYIKRSKKNLRYGHTLKDIAEKKQGKNREKLESKKKSRQKKELI